jgi:hypothetical protein
MYGLKAVQEGNGLENALTRILIVARRIKVRKAPLLTRSISSPRFWPATSGSSQYPEGPTRLVRQIDGQNGVFGVLDRLPVQDEEEAT